MNNLQPKVDNLARKVQSVAYKLHSILAWDGEVMNTLYLFQGLFLLSIIFSVMNYFSDFIVLIVSGIHLYGADFMVRQPERHIATSRLRSPRRRRARSRPTSTS